MRIIKKLHWFVLKSFLPLFAMTFFIVLFIVLMQFLWKYIDELVGKGLSIDVLAELFFYAAVSMIPMALPLAILLASLMTFGNFGEKFELTAMKASGISLVRVMTPLIWFISVVAVGAFFFQNDVLPHAQVKMWTLLFSMKQKSPELEIPEGVFYDQIPGFNIFVKEKNLDTGMLYDVFIYDLRSGRDNTSIITADSARLAFTKDNKYLYLFLSQGEQFENLKEQTGNELNVPFRRERFQVKEVLIPFDANFNRLDDETMRRQYVGKNISELKHTIDSVGHRLDSLGNEYTVMVQRTTSPFLALSNDSIKEKKKNDATYSKLNINDLLLQLSGSDRNQVFSRARSEIRNRRAEYEFKAMSVDEDKRNLRRHEIEMLKKYTLSVACLIMFFIGAPLGAIIRKGGIGTPLVISVLLFLVYYIIDNTGYKMARDGHIIVWIGMWLSTAILAPLGIYVTWKAMNDSSVFNKDLYMNYLRRIIGTRQKRSISVKEVIINEITLAEALRLLVEIRDFSGAFLSRLRRVSFNYVEYWRSGINIDELNNLIELMDENIVALTDLRNSKLVNRLNEFPNLRSLWIYHPSNKKWLSIAFMSIFPIGLPIWLVALRYIHGLKKDLLKVESVSRELMKVVERTV